MTKVASFDLNPSLSLIYVIFGRAWCCLNLPVGEVISKGMNLREIDARKLLDGFYEKEFSGYLIITLEGFDGVEEGVVIFKEGSLTAAVYEYDLYGVTVFGDAAVNHFFNALAAQYIVGDVVSLSNQQVDLIIAFNEKSKLNRSVSKADIPKLMQRLFSTAPAKSVLGQYVKKEESKRDIFKKFGLAGLGE